MEPVIANDNLSRSDIITSLHGHGNSGSCISDNIKSFNDYCIPGFLCQRMNFEYTANPGSVNDWTGTGSSPECNPFINVDQALCTCFFTFTGIVICSGTNFNDITIGCSGKSCIDGTVVGTLSCIFNRQVPLSKRESS